MTTAKNENALVEAKIAALEAKTAAALADARRTTAEALNMEYRAGVNKIDHDKAIESEIVRKASDEHHHTLRFLGPITAATAKEAVSTLVRWSRVDPGCAITFVIDSPGGGIIEGFHLFDVLLELRENGHELTTITNGMAASMGGILLQAGTRRLAGPNASILIHEASFATGGSMGQVEDTVEFAKKLQERLVGILAERSTLSKTQIKARWKRKNWWLDADEALKYGFVDAIR